MVYIKETFSNVSKSFGSFRKFTENHRPKSSYSVHHLYQKQNNTWFLEDMNLCFRVQLECSSLVRYQIPHSNTEEFISPRIHGLFFMYACSITKNSPSQGASEHLVYITPSILQGHLTIYFLLFY